MLHCICKAETYNAMLVTEQENNVLKKRLSKDSIFLLVHPACVIVFTIGGKNSGDRIFLRSLQKLPGLCQVF